MALKYCTDFAEKVTLFHLGMSVRFRSFRHLQISQTEDFKVGTEMSAEESDSQVILLNELSKANLTNLVLKQDGEDVFECADGQVTTELATAKPREVQTPALHRNEIIMEITEERMQAIAIEQRRRAKQQQHENYDRIAGGKRNASSEHEIACEETLGNKIEKIMNRIVVRRQRAYLTGLLQDPTKARTAKLIEQYKKNTASHSDRQKIKTNTK